MTYTRFYSHPFSSIFFANVRSLNKESTVKNMMIILMLIVDFILFFIFPLIFWELCREGVGDYTAMILSTVPGILYTLYRFKNNARLNYTGIFVILNLILGLLVDILSGSAL